jgi:hypothetical protein
MDLSFRHFYENDERAQKLMDNPHISFFFRKDGEVFGGPEESRLVFARMKNPERGEKTWAAEASFAAVGLKRAIDGDVVQRLFSGKDLDSIEVLDKEKAFKGLKKE